MGYYESYTGVDINEEVDDLAFVKNAVLLDVRTPREFAAGHIPGAVNLDYREIVPQNAGMIEEALPDKSAPIYSYCRSGARSGMAVGILKQMGYMRVTNLGGIINYDGELEV